MQTRAAADQEYVIFETGPPGVRALTTTRETPPDPEHPSLPDPRFLTALDIPADHFAWCAQVHGARILASVTGGRQGDADALVTDRSDLVLSIRTADCVPVFLADPARGTLALAHAGWRGAAAGIVEATVEALRWVYGSRPEDLWAGIGPAIGPDAYEVGAEVAGAFAERYVRPHGERWLLDLPGAVAGALSGAGVRDVERSGLCTVTRNDRFFSYRREGTTGRLYSLIWREE